MHNYYYYSLPRKNYLVLLGDEEIVASLYVKTGHGRSNFKSKISFNSAKLSKLMRREANLVI